MLKYRNHPSYFELHGSPTPNLKFSNSAQSPLSIPGFDGMPIYVELPPTQRFAHGFGDWIQNRLTRKEIEMMRFMDSVVEIIGWEERCDDEVWRQEVWDKGDFGNTLEGMEWEWCRRELKDKAKLYKERGIVYVIDSGPKVCKADVLPLYHEGEEDIVKELTRQIEELGKTYGKEEMMVDPDLYPLAWGTTRVLLPSSSNNPIFEQDIPPPAREKILEKVGQGEITYPQSWKCKIHLTDCYFDGVTRRTRKDCEEGNIGPDPMQRKFQKYRFGSEAQWLPCEVEFVKEEGDDVKKGEGKGKKKVKITSYINNLHPKRHEGVYDVIEKFIEKSILPWNEVLMYREKGRTPERIRTFGVKWDHGYLDPESLGDLEQFMATASVEKIEETKRRLREVLEKKDNPRAPAASERYPDVGENWEEEGRYSFAEAWFYKYHRVRRWLEPNAGESFSYEEWKAGKNSVPIVNGFVAKAGKLESMPLKGDHQFYKVDLEEQFGKEGLQVVVEIGCVELGPGEIFKKDRYWYLSGTLNERIGATSIVYFSSENMTSSSGSMTFRTEADMDPDDYVWGCGTGSNPHHPLEPIADIFGFESYRNLCRIDGESIDEREEYMGDGMVQELGTVEFPDGKLIAWPNVLQYRDEGFELLDKTKSGRRRFLKLHLVDPHYRICSTKNTPPQQHDWWIDAALNEIDWEKREVPPELVQKIAGYTEGFPMSKECAEMKFKASWMRSVVMRSLGYQTPAYDFDKKFAIGGMDDYR